MLITPVLQGEDRGSEGLPCMSGRVEGKAGGSVLPSLSLCYTAQMSFPKGLPGPFLPPGRHAHSPSTGLQGSNSGCTHHSG